VRYAGLGPAIRPWAARDGPLGPPLPAACATGTRHGLSKAARDITETPDGVASTCLEERLQRRTARGSGRVDRPPRTATAPRSGPRDGPRRGPADTSPRAGV